MKNQLLQTFSDWQAEMTDIRRSFHACPELAFEEKQTSGMIADLLKSWGIETHTGLGGTGVVGHISGRPGRAIGLRADIDALPIQEANTFAHASRNPGKMHACGHDGHTTMLLAAARYLSQHRDFTGNIYFIFQPAEEGGAGALRMIEDGLFELFPVDGVFGMHNWPGMPAGSFGVTAGPIMASSNIFEVVLHGRGAHGAMPHLGIDPVMAATQLIQAWQTIVTRNLDPLHAAVISTTQLQAGTAYNIIPDDAIVRGTVRTLDNSVLDTIEERMQDITEKLAQALGCEASFRFQREYPPTINHVSETRFCTSIMQDLAGADKVNTKVMPSMGAEDFAFMLQEKPGCYVWLGNGHGDHRAPGHGPGPCLLHNNSYDFNDALIPIGASYWVMLAQGFLTEPPS